MMRKFTIYVYDLESFIYINKMIPDHIQSYIFLFLQPSEIDIVYAGFEDVVEEAAKMLMCGADKHAAINRYIVEGYLTGIYILLLTRFPSEKGDLSPTKRVSILYTASSEGGYPICKHILDKYEREYTSVRKIEHMMSNCLINTVKYGDKDLVGLFGERCGPLDIRVIDIIRNREYKSIEILITLLHHTYSRRQSPIIYAGLKSIILSGYGDEGYEYIEKLLPKLYMSITHGEGESLLEYSLGNSSYKIARYLLEQGCRCKRSYLIRAFRSGNLEVIKLLKEYGHKI